MTCHYLALGHVICCCFSIAFVAAGLPCFADLLCNSMLLLHQCVKTIHKPARTFRGSFMMPSLHALCQHACKQCKFTEQLLLQVVDLEVAADHRGSILGDHPTRLQPPQKMFESKLLHQMRNFSVQRPVFIESESSLVGRRQVPNAMWKVCSTCRTQSIVPGALCLMALTAQCMADFEACIKSSMHV